MGVRGGGPEVSLLHRLIALHLPRGTECDLVSEVEHGDLLRHPHHELHHVLHEQDRHARVPYPANAPAQILDLLPVHAGRRLIQQQQPGTGGRGARELQAPLLPECEIRRELIALVSQIRELEQLRDLPPRAAGGAEPAREKPLRGDVLRRVLRHPQVLPHREVGEQADVLEGPGDSRPQAQVRRLAVHQIPVESNGPRSFSVHPANHVDGGALSRPVGADQAEDVALVDGEVQLVVGLDPAEVLRQPAQLEHRPTPDRGDRRRASGPGRCAHRRDRKVSDSSRR